MSIPCPYCSTQLNNHETYQKDVRPSKGDVSICFHCKSILLFEDNQAIRKPTDGELEEMREDKSFWNALQNIIKTIETFET